MRKTRYFILGALVLSFGATPALTHASWEGGPGGGGGHGRHGGFMMGGGPGMALHMILRKLNLTSEQQSLLDSKLAPHKAKLQSLFQQIHASRKSLDAQFFSDNPPTAVDPDLKKLQDDLMDEGLATALEIRTFLVSQNLWPQAVQVWQQMETMRAQMHNFFGETQ